MNVMIQAGSLRFLILPLLAITAAAAPSSQARPQGGKQPMLHLTSSAFVPEGNIPQEFTCDGRNISPELSWSGAPAETKSFALVMHDPDAPVSGGFTHWLVYNIPAKIDHLPEHVPNQDAVPGGGVQAKNDGGKYGYMGPCPPSGTHRYYFRLYALDMNLDGSAGSSKTALEKAIEAHVLAQAELMGRYRRSAGKAA
jgi:Raf kinase inhibitor-like YbhB/YbcL family protein